MIHTVESFGSILGEEIVASWRRNLESNRIMSADVPVKSSTPLTLDPTEKSAASTPQPQEAACLPQVSPIEPMMNGNPKSPEDNNNLHLSNNNVPLAATMCAVNNFLRSEESMKNPYRFDDHRSVPIF